MRGPYQANIECDRLSEVKKIAKQLDMQPTSNISLKKACESENIYELPDWFAKTKEVRLRICFPNAFDPKYIMARRRLFKQMKILKEEHALKSKGTGAVIKLTPCAPPSFARNSKHLKFKPIKGHVVKPTQSTNIISSSVSALHQEEEQSRAESAEAKNVKKESVQISNDKIDRTDNTKTNTPAQNESNVDDKSFREKEAQSNSSDSQEEERPKRRTRRR